MAARKRKNTIVNQFQDLFFGYRPNGELVTSQTHSSASVIRQNLFRDGIAFSDDDLSYLGNTKESLDGKNKKVQVNEFWAKNPFVFTVIDKIARQAADIPIKAYEVVDELALTKYKAFKHKCDTNGHHNFKELLQLKRMAMRELDVEEMETLPFMTILKKPNVLQHENTFREQAAISFLVTGESLINGSRTTPNAPFSELVNMLPHKIDFVFGDAANPVRGYKVEDGNYSREIPYHDVIQRVRPNIQALDNLDSLRGFSPLQPLSLIIQRSNSSLIASKSAFDNNGVSGILAADPKMAELGMTPSEVKVMNDAMTAEWGGAENNNRVRAIPSAVKYFKTGLSPVDLGIEGANRNDLRTIASVYDVPSVLVGDSENSTYNNMKTAEKAFYTNAVMPYNKGYVQSLNDGFMTDWNIKLKSNYILDCDYTAVNALSEDFQEQAMTFIGLVEAGITSRAYAAEQLNVELGEEPVESASTEQKYVRLRGNMFKHFPKEAVKNSQKALKDRESLMKATVQRAESIVSNKSMSIPTIKRTLSKLSSAAVSKEVKLAYGGDAMKVWCEFIIEKYSK